VKITHGTTCIDPCVQRRSLEARLISLQQGKAPMGTTKQAEMTNYYMKCDRSVALRWALHEDLYHLTISRHQ